MGLLVRRIRTGWSVAADTTACRRNHCCDACKPVRKAPKVAASAAETAKKTADDAAGTLDNVSAKTKETVTGKATSNIADKTYRKSSGQTADKAAKDA